MNETERILWPGWETVRLIGRGSFGAVYEIQRDVLGEVEKAALKVISIPQNDSDIEELYSDGYDDESITNTFKSHLKSIVAEYSLMRKMNGCSNVVNCDDVRYIQHDDGIGWDIFIKMELLTPLTKAVAADCTEATVIKIAKDMCTALELCKKHEIVHRDIKPQNIFVSPNGDYKLGDFGIAKTVEKTMGGTKIGTYKYMAPEVYHYQPYGHSADIYSLGLVLYWLLNERRMPFMPLPPEKLKAGVEEQARNRRLSGETLPEPAKGSRALRRIVLKACAYDPKERYQTATDMLRDIVMLQETDLTQTSISQTTDRECIANSVTQSSAPSPDRGAGPNKKPVVDKKPSPPIALADDKKQPENEPVAQQKTPSSWRCTCGRENTAYVSSCVCGNNKATAREYILEANKNKQDTATESIKRDVVCPVCGHKQGNGKFCRKCGYAFTQNNTKKDVVCPVCGHKQVGQQVCWRCGYNYNSRNNQDSGNKATIDNVVAVQENSTGEVVCPVCGHKQKGHHVCWKCGQKFSFKAPNGNGWQCVCGRRNPAYVSTCYCGINKYDLSISLPPNRTTLHKEYADGEYVPGRMYYNGDEVVFEGQKYLCVAPKGVQCVWNPSQQPKHWQLMVKQTTEDWRKSEAAHRAWLKSLEE